MRQQSVIAPDLHRRRAVPFQPSRGWALVAALFLIAGVQPTDEPASTLPGVGVPATCDVSAPAWVESAYADWLRIFRGAPTLAPERFYQRAGPLVARTFAIEAIANRAYGDRWDRLDDHQKTEFVEALSRYLAKRMEASFNEANGTPELLETVLTEPGRLQVRYSLAAADKEKHLSVQLEAGTDGTCRIVDIKGDEEALLESVRKRVEDLREDYSFQYMVAELGDFGFVRLEDFESSPEGELPSHWEWKDKDDDSHKPYSVKTEAGNKYLEATDAGESVILGRNVKWNMDRYPYVSFRVRVWEFPEGGDESDDSAVDSAAGIYFTYKKKLFGKIPESAKYVWSSTLPIGTAVRREGIGRPWQIVFGTGADGLGEWRTYVFDLRQAYRDTFGGDPPSTPIGIGVLSDANSLNAKAHADYDDIRALRSAPEGVSSGVVEILQPKSKREG